MEEIATAAHLNKKEVGRVYRYLVKELGTFVPPSIERQHVAKFSNKLEVSAKTEVLAIKLLNQAKNLHLTSGRSPQGISAAVIYIAATLTNEKKKQKEVAEDRSAQVQTGDRSQKIRTYNFPQNRVTDHRINLALHRLENIMKGDLDQLFSALAKL